jgi:type VI protein secretion system component VasF
MPSDPDAPPPPAPDKGDADKAARIVERYRAGHDLAPDEVEPLERAVQEAIGELTGGAPDPRDAAARPARRGSEDPARAMPLWRRLVLAAVGIGLLLLLWQRFAWIG